MREGGRSGGGEEADASSADKKWGSTKPSRMRPWVSAPAVSRPWVFHLVSTFMTN